MPGGPGLLLPGALEGKRVHSCPTSWKLFAGTQSVSKVFREQGWTATTVDLDPASQPDIVGDIGTMDLALLPEHVDCVWASPPCTHYSVARTTAKTPRDLEGSDALVRRSLEIIGRYPGCAWFMENPQGLLMHREVVRGLPLRLVDYCQYRDGRFPAKYRKRTCLWTNVEAWVPRPLCNRRTCGSMGPDGRHSEYAQRWPRKRDGLPFKDGHPIGQLYSIPPALLEHIAASLL